MKILIIRENKDSNNFLVEVYKALRKLENKPEIYLGSPKMYEYTANHDPKLWEGEDISKIIDPKSKL